MFCMDLRMGEAEVVTYMKKKKRTQGKKTKIWFKMFVCINHVCKTETTLTVERNRNCSLLFAQLVKGI